MVRSEKTVNSFLIAKEIVELFDCQIVIKIGRKDIKSELLREKRYKNKCVNCLIMCKKKAAFKRL